MEKSNEQKLYRLFKIKSLNGYQDNRSIWNNINKGTISRSKESSNLPTSKERASVEKDGKK